MVLSFSVDEVAEWLRRWTANPMCSARVGSNPILVGGVFFQVYLPETGNIKIALIGAVSC